MTDITITKAAGIWTVAAEGAIIGESSNALELREGGLAPVIYFPRADITMSFFDPVAHSADCPAKGTASYYSVITKSRTIENAAWSYEDPSVEASQIKGHLAFHANDWITVEQV